MRWIGNIVSWSINPQMSATIGIKYVTEAPKIDVVFFIKILNSIIETAEPKIPSKQMLVKLFIAIGLVCTLSKKSVVNKYTPEIGPTNAKAQTAHAIEFTPLK